MWYLFIQVLFLPLRFLYFIGRINAIQKFAREPILFSEERKENTRSDLIAVIESGGETILDHNDIDNIPVSRHKYRQHGIEVVREWNKSFSTGEIAVSTTVILIGFLATVLTVSPAVRGSFSLIGLSSTTLTGVSILTTILGFLLLVLVYTREMLVNQLTYDDSSLSKGEPSELLSKMVWNQFVTANIGKAVGAFYLLAAASLIGRQTRSVVLEFFEIAMDPNNTRSEAMGEWVPKITATIQEEIDSK